MVQIWLTCVDKVELPVGTKTFSGAELERAERMSSASLRQRFLGRRWLARNALAGETGGDPGELILERRCERCDRLHPASPLRPGSREVWWSASNSGALAAVATSPSRIGLDIEISRERPRWERIAARFFSEQEQRALAGSQARFLEFWTLKEAYLKAQGVGLVGGLGSLECTGLLPVQDGWSTSPEHPGWHFQKLSPQPGLVAAIAVQGTPERVELRRWP